MLAGITAARLLSLREEEPEVFQRVDMLMDNMDKIRWVVNINKTIREPWRASEFQLDDRLTDRQLWDLTLQLRE